MATIQSPGIGSGLDVNSLVQQLVAAEGAAHSQRLTTREARITSQISALGSLKGSLSAFKSALEALKTESALAPRKASVADDEIFTATAEASAVPGTYDIEVVALATTHQLASAAFSEGADHVVGTGTLTITSGSNTFTVEIDETNNTVAGIRTAINSAVGNTSVQATLVHEVDGTHLVLTSIDTGEDNAITITASGGDGGLDQLVYDPGVLENLDELKAAQDAHVRIAGFDHFSTTNTISGAIDGVTLTLKTASPDTEVALTISHDSAAVTERIKKFISEFNALNAQIKRLRSYSPETKVAGPMLGDSMLRGIEEQIRRGLSDPVSGLTGPYRTLADIGITRELSGELTLDESKLNAALGEDRAAVAALFGSTNGVAARLYTEVDAHLASSGGIQARNDSLQKGLSLIAKDREALNLRLASLEQRYRRQFTALDTLLMRMQSTSSFLASQLANLPKPGGGES